MPQDMPPVGGYEAVQYKVGFISSGFFFWDAVWLGGLGCDWLVGGGGWVALWLGVVREAPVLKGCPCACAVKEVDYMVVFAVADKMRMWEAGARRAVSGTGGFRRVMRVIPLGFSAEGMETNVEGGAHTEDHNQPNPPSQSIARPRRAPIIRGNER